MKMKSRNSTYSAKWVMLALALLMPLSAMADPKPGTETKAWLDLQKSDKAASKEPRPVPGEVAEKTYDRYLKSFDHPIPEEFTRESFSSGNSGGGSGSNK